MTSIPSPEELRRTKQVIPTDKLIRWAEALGFAMRRPAGGSSHIVYRHEEYPDLGSVFLVNTKKRLGSQHSFADCLKELYRRQALEKEAAKDFKDSSENRVLEDVAEKLPLHIKAERNHETGQIVLRDRNLPQLGLTIHPGEERIIENKVRYLEDLKREAFILLNRARMNYDINAGMDHGVFTGQLSHQVYRNLPKAMITPYQAGEMPDKIFTGLQEYIGRVEERDLEHRIRLEDALDSPAISGILVAFHTRRGDRTNRVVYERPGYEEGLSFEFKTRSNRRAAIENDHARISGSELTRVEKIMDGVRAKAPALVA